MAFNEKIAIMCLLISFISAAISLRIYRRGKKITPPALIAISNLMRALEWHRNFLKDLPTDKDSSAEILNFLRVTDFYYKNVISLLNYALTVDGLKIHFEGKQ